jgi:hypothetical protein
MLAGVGVVYHLGRALKHYGELEKRKSVASFSVTLLALFTLNDFPSSSIAHLNKRES